MFSYKTQGVCSKEIKFDIIDNKIAKVVFVGGCPGNLLGISKLVEGLEPKEAITKLKGVRCGSKSTSCPDQFAIALEEYCK